MDAVTLSFIPALSMMLLGILSTLAWRRATALRSRWFALGAGLWTVAIALKIGYSAIVNQVVFATLQRHAPYPVMVVVGGLYVGLVSSAFEMGLTLLAVAIRRDLGEDENRAIGIGLGAGAFEAFVLGLWALVAVLIAIAGLPAHVEIRAALEASAAATPLFWLVAPVERALVIPCHAASRALVLLGYKAGKGAKVFWGFLLFTALDSVVGAAHVSGIVGKISMWWIELAILPFALIGLAIIARSSSVAASLFPLSRWRAGSAGR